MLIEIADYFNIVINDEEKEKLTEENSEKINEDTNETKIPIYSVYGSYKNIKNFGKHYIKKYNKDLKEAGIEGLAKYLIDLINCYNTSIEGIKEISKMFNK